MATATEVRQAHTDMLDAAARLVEEIEDVPAGVVLRSYWRAVRLVRHAGCPLPAMATEADRVARDLLVARGVRVPATAASHPRAPHPRVPRPRRALVPLTQGSA